MAKAISSEELQLKKRARRRLVGAIALVLIVVVFLPMILDNEPRQMSQDIAINIPALPQDGAAELKPTEPLRFKPVESPTPTESSATRAEPATKPGRVTSSLPANEKSARQSKNASVAGEFVVQLGAFSKSENAASLASMVRKGRFEAYTEVVTTTQGDRTRVRVGPYPTRVAAEDARTLLKRRKLNFGEPTIVRLSQ